jgi:hypothetical protein
MIKEYIYGGIIIALITALWWFGVHERDIGEAKIRAEYTSAAQKQQDQFNIKLKMLGDQHDQQIAALNALPLEPPVARILCYYRPNPLPPLGLHDDQNPSTTLVHSDAPVHPDFSEAARLFAERDLATQLLLRRADKLNIDAIELNKETH